MIKKENMAEINRYIIAANDAKDRLAMIARELEELGAVRKAKSCWNLVYSIEEWQRRGL